MWQANVARTERKGDRLDIIIHYSNGVNEYDQTLSTTAVQDPSWLSDQLTAKLNQLNEMDDFEASVKLDSVLTSTVSVDAGGVILQTPISLEVT